MQFLTFSSLALALSTIFIAAPSSGFIEKDYYIKNIAPTQVQRLSDFAASQADLTADQLAILSKASTAVSAYDLFTLGSLERQIESIFTSDDAKYILGGDAPAPKTRRGETNIRCQCATRSDKCNNNTHCSYDELGCYWESKGRGSFWIYACNGLCIN